MKLSKLSVENYRGLRGESVEFSGFNLFIGAKASGKSTILDKSFVSSPRLCRVHRQVGILRSQPIPASRRLEKFGTGKT